MSKTLVRAPALAMNPMVTGTLHYLLTKAPDRFRLPILALLNRRFSQVTVTRLIKAIKVLWLLGTVNQVNARLNAWALNNWQWTPRKDKWNWNWEIAVVTGGCNGIGKEIVKGLVGLGVRVAVLDVAPLPDDFKRKTKIVYIQCDVTSPSSIANAAKEIRSQLGDPTILVNNAGIGQPHSLVETTNEWVTKIFQINIISHFWMVKEFLPHMLKQNKGHIVGLASMASFVAPPGVVDYASTKAAVLAFHEGLGQEIKHIYKTPGVLNTVVHPSWVRTAIVAGYEDHLERTQGPIMKPEYVGRKVVEQIENCTGGQVILPPPLKLAPGIRALPNWLQESIRDLAVGRAGSEYKKNP